MAKKYSNKINKIRTFALSLIFVGFIIMYFGIFFRTHPIVMTIFMVLGLLSIIASTVVYFWIGMLSTKAVQVVCPNCNKPTKILGRVDMCMHCREPLTLDPNLEGKDFDENYNRKKPQRTNQTKKNCSMIHRTILFNVLFSSILGTCRRFPCDDDSP